MSPTTKAQQKAVHKYVKENYDRLSIAVSKGRKGDIKAHADVAEQSVNAYVVQAVDERMERDDNQ